MPFGELNLGMGLAGGLVGSGPPANAFVSTWNTTNTSTGSSSSNQITLPLNDRSLTYNFTVDWGDGTQDTITAFDQGEKTHTYAASGVYRLVIQGTMQGWFFEDSGDKEKILEVSQWGEFESVYRYCFWGCSNLEVTATDTILFSGEDLVTAHSAFQASGITRAPFAVFADGCTNADDIFRDTASLTEVPVYDFNNVTSLFSALRNSALTELPKGFGSALGGVTDFSNFLEGSTLTTESYSRFLEEIEAVNQNDSLDFHGGNSQYNTAGGVARQALIDRGWTITDGGAAS